MPSIEVNERELKQSVSCSELNIKIVKLNYYYPKIVYLDGKRKTSSTT